MTEGEDLQADVLSVLQEVGITARLYDADTFVPATGDVTESTSYTSITSSPLYKDSGFSKDTRDPLAKESNKRRVIVSGSEADPVPGQRLLISSEVWTIVAAEKLSYSTTTVAYELVVQK